MITQKACGGQRHGEEEEEEEERRIVSAGGCCCCYHWRSEIKLRGDVEGGLNWSGAEGGGRGFMYRRLRGRETDSFSNRVFISTLLARKIVRLCCRYHK